MITKPKKIFILINGRHKEITYKEFKQLSLVNKIQNKKFIRVDDFLFETEENAYRSYYKYLNHCRYVKKTKEQSNIVILSYNALDSDEFNGEDIIADIDDSFVDDIETKLIYEKLHSCIDLLASQEQELIRAIFFKNYSERELSKLMGIPQTTISYRKRKILSKLKNLLEN